MKRNIKLTRLFTAIRLVFLLSTVSICSVVSGRAATFTVTNTADSGAGSLRQAILDANANPGADTVVFNIAGAGPHTIQPLSNFPNILGPVTIDGFTQPGASPNSLPVGNNAVLLIEIDGTAMGGSGNGSNRPFMLAGSGVTIRGLVINRANIGIMTSDQSSGHVIAGNFIGTDPTGTLDLGNHQGVYLFRSNAVRIGGTTPADRNVISGNNDQGIVMSDAPDNTVQGNYIGTNAAGTSALGNGNHGIGMSKVFGGSNGNLIGGTAPGAGNVVSGNGGCGVDDANNFGPNTIRGNFIGTNASGTSALGNANGICAGTANVIVGGTSAGAGNVISGNVNIGVYLIGPDVVVQGNKIGVAADGVTAMGNGGNGIQLSFSAGGFFFGGPSRIGGTDPGAGNVIAHNGQNGILAFCCGGNPHTFLQNAIYSNGARGIDIGAHVNDPADVDGGTNNGQNFPVLTSAVLAGGNTTIQGALNSVANTTFRIEFFSNSECDGTGNGEGRTFLGSANVVTDAGGDAAISVVLPVSVAGGFITSTATRLDGSGNPTDTSEFSACLSVTTGPSCSTITVNPSSVPGGTAGSAYSQTVTAAGGSGPYSFAVSAGSLPAGLSINSSTGMLSGTPSATGTFVFTVTATDSNDCTGSREYSITVACPTITIDQTTLPGGAVGSAYNQTVSASGGVGSYTYSVSGGSLPPGLSLDQNTGTLTGTSAVSGSYNFTISATDGNGCTGSRAFSFEVSCPIVTLSPSSVPDGSVGVAYNQALSAGGTGGTFTFAVTSGSLPTGLTLSPSGILSGTPTASGSFTFTVTTTDAAAGGCSGSRSYTINVDVVPPVFRCPLSHGYWKNNPGAWPVASLVLGGQTYTQTELLTILNTPIGSGKSADASLILARQLIAAKLNVANGSDPGPVSTMIADADVLLSVYSGRLPYRVRPSSGGGQSMVAAAAELESYNDGMLTIVCQP